MPGDGRHQQQDHQAGGPEGEDPGEAGGLLHQGAHCHRGSDCEPGLCYIRVPSSQDTVDTSGREDSVQW